MKPFLPQVTAPVVSEIDAPRVLTMRLLEEFGQAVFAFGNDDEVNVVWHQAIRPDSHTRLCFCFSQQLYVELVVFFAKKGGLSPIARRLSVTLSPHNAVGTRNAYFGDLHLPPVRPR